MGPWLRRLLEPAKTSPTDSFRWNDRRSKRQQIVNGFRIAGGLIGGFAVMMAVLVGLGRLAEDHRNQTGSSILLSWLAVVAAALIMVWTAHRWAPFVTGFFFGPAVLKILGVLTLGDDSYYSAHSMTRTSVAELLAYALVVVVLTARFVGKRPAMTTGLDRIALTVFVFATFKQVLMPHPFPAWWLLAGVTALFIAWCAHRLEPDKPAPRHRHGAAPISSVGSSQ
jgi:hypothetical protein